jgi:lipopolysaccharide transport system ATP-binding protein
MPVAVEFQAVCKGYPLSANAWQRARSVLSHLGFGPGDKELFYALRDVSFRVLHGERVGVVGRNGSGKSTILKLISGNFAPTSGRVLVHGSVQTLMQTGLGFHPEFTGFENLRHSLAYNGVPRRDIPATIEDIIEFAELHEYLHQPLRTYSLGMQMRLQFAAATALKPDVLIIDEVLSSGDSYFAAKSQDRIQRLISNGCTLLLVSHSGRHILNFCERVIWLHRGKIVEDGPAFEVLSNYETYLEHESEGLRQSRSVGASNDDSPQIPLDTLADGKPVRRWPSNRGLKVTSITAGQEERGAATLAPDDALRISFTLVAEMNGPFVCTYYVTIWRADGKRIARVESPLDQFELDEGQQRLIAVELRPLLIGPGDYRVSLSVFDKSETESTTAGRSTRFDVLAYACAFRVRGDTTRHKAVYLHPATWQFDEARRCAA